MEDFSVALDSVAIASSLQKCFSVLALLNPVRYSFLFILKILDLNCFYLKYFQASPIDV